MSTLHQVKNLILVHRGLHILVVSRYLREGSKHIELRNDGRNLLQQRVVGRGDFEDLLHELVLLDSVLIFVFIELSNKVFETRAGEAHESVLDGDNFVVLF